MTVDYTGSDMRASLSKFRKKYKNVNFIFVNPVNLQNLGTLEVEQFPNRAWYNFFLKIIFLSSMSASISSQNWTKLQQTKQTKHETKQTTTIFPAKNK